MIAGVERGREEEAGSRISVPGRWQKRGWALETMMCCLRQSSGWVEEQEVERNSFASNVPRRARPMSPGFFEKWPTLLKAGARPYTSGRQKWVQKSAQKDGGFGMVPRWLAGRGRGGGSSFPEPRDSKTRENWSLPHLPDPRPGFSSPRSSFSFYLPVSFSSAGCVTET